MAKKLNGKEISVGNERECFSGASQSEIPASRLKLEVLATSVLA